MKKYIALLLGVLTLSAGAGERLIYVARHCQAAGKGKGVVRDPAIHKEVLDDFVALTKEIDFKILGLTFSPVKGPEGNIEFLAHLTLDDKPSIEPDTASVVADAHNSFKG